MVTFADKDANICVENSYRLLKDSFSVKPPTRYGIMELSLEEAAKAWWIHFAVHPEDRFGELKKINYNQRIETKFKSHEVKVGEVQEITRLILADLDKYTLTRRDVDKIVESKLKNYTEYSKQKPQIDAKIKKLMADPGERIRRLSAILETIITKEPRDITMIKEDSFYVNIVNGRFAEPNMQQDYRLLAWIVIFVFMSKELLADEKSDMKELFALLSRDPNINKQINKVSEDL